MLREENRRPARGRGGVSVADPGGSARQGAILEEPGGAALGDAAEQLQDLEPEQRDEGLLAGVRQVGAPAVARGPEHAVVVDTDDAADPDAFTPFQCGEGTVEIGRAEALLGEQGPGLGLSGA
jgi:hypothetical protein